MRMRIARAWPGLLLVGVLRADPVLERAPTPGGPWTQDAGATIAEAGPNQWRILTPVAPGLPSGFYRVTLDQRFSAVEVTGVQLAISGLQLDAVGTPAAGPEERQVSLPGEVPLVLVRIPAGAFQMGSPPTEGSRQEDEGPLHTVAIGYPFYIGRHEVTQAQWIALMGSNPSYFAGDTSRPVDQVSWDDAKSFITALNSHIVATGQGPLTARLPTEAEWEYACRAGTQTRFSFGDSLEVGDGCSDDGVRGQYMWYCGNSGNQTHPVGTKLPNAFGLYDMHGNVWEWCEDCYHPNYSGAPSDGTAWLTSPTSDRVPRGGAWNYDAQYCRSAHRDPAAPTTRYYEWGLRVAAVQ